MRSRQLGPGRGRLHVDLDHAGVGGDRSAWLIRGSGGGAVALEHHRQSGVCAAARSISREQLDEVLEPLERRQEDVDEAVARLDHQRGPARRLLGSTTTARGGLAPRLQRRSAPRGTTPRRRTRGSRQEIELSGSRSPPVSRRAPAPAGRDGTARRGWPSPRRTSDGSSGSTQAAGSAASARSSSATSVRTGAARVDRPGRGPSAAGPRRPAARAGPRRPACSCSAGSPKSAVTARASASASAGASGSAARRRTGRRAARGRSTAARRRCATCSAICQRGSGSPGYHLPWPRCTSPPLAYRSAEPLRRAGWPASRFSGPSAATRPLRRGHVVERDERRLAAHGQPHAGRRAAARRPPRRAVAGAPAAPSAVGLGDPRVLVDPAAPCWRSSIVDLGRARWPR